MTRWRLARGLAYGLACLALGVAWGVVLWWWLGCRAPGHAPRPPYRAWRDCQVRGGWSGSGEAGRNGADVKSFLADST